MPKYPDWKGQWIGGWTQRFPGVTGQPSYDPHKSAGAGQQAPLTPEYQGHFRGQPGGPGCRRPRQRTAVCLHPVRHAANDDRVLRREQTAM
jgi:hypothetical protein